MSKTIHVRWEASDGYVGGARPQSTRLDPNHFDPSDTDEEIANAVRDAVEDDFRQIVTVYLRDDEVAKAVASIRASIGKGD